MSAKTIPDIMLWDLPWVKHPLDPEGELATFFDAKGNHVSIARTRFTGGLYSVAVTPKGKNPSDNTYEDKMRMRGNMLSVWIRRFDRHRIRRVT